MRREYKIGLYIGASLLSAALLYFILFFQPHRSALSRVDETSKSFDDFTNAINEGSHALSQQAGPDSIKPGVVGNVRSFNQDLTRTLTALDIGAFEKPSAVSNRWKDSLFRDFNAVVSNIRFSEDLQQANSVIVQAHSFTAYNYDVMQALRNILEYNPQDDLNIEDTEGLLALIRAAGGGIELTIQKLEAQTYPKDEGLNRIIQLLNELEVKRLAYEQSIEAGDIKGQAYQDFVKAVESTQTETIANRQLFWESQHADLTERLEQAYQLMNPYLNRLNNL